MSSVTKGSWVIYQYKADAAEILEIFEEMFPWYNHNNKSYFILIQSIQIYDILICHINTTCIVSLTGGSNI